MAQRKLYSDGPNEPIVRTAEDTVTSAATVADSLRIKKEILDDSQVSPPPSPSPRGTPPSSPENDETLSAQIFGTSILASKKPASPSRTDVPLCDESGDSCKYELSPDLFTTTVNASLETLVKEASNGDEAFKIKQEKLSDEENE